MTNNLTYEQALLLKTDLEKSGINYLVSDDEDGTYSVKQTPSWLDDPYSVKLFNRSKQI
jgi:hypothetical protein